MSGLVPERRGPWRRAWRVLRARRGPRLALMAIGMYTAMAAWGEAVVLWHRGRDRTPAYQEVRIEEANLPPFWLRRARADAPGADAQGGLRRLAYRPLGSDGLGRDLLPRLVQGTRIAFRVGLLTSLIAIPLGVVLGAAAGYYGGRVDDAVVWLYTTFAAVPGLLFVLAVALLVGRGLTGVCLGIGLSTWVGLCRLIRAEVMKHRALDYVTAARVLGVPGRRILLRHIGPNVLHLVIVTFTLRFPAAIGMEVFLSFIGVGLQGEPSWGSMIANGRLSLWQGAWWELGFATLAIFGLVLAFHVLGDALRDALDPRLSGGLLAGTEAAP